MGLRVEVERSHGVSVDRQNLASELPKALKVEGRRSASRLTLDDSVSSCNSTKSSPLVCCLRLAPNPHSASLSILPINLSEYRTCIAAVTM